MVYEAPIHYIRFIKGSTGILPVKRDLTKDCGQGCPPYLKVLPSFGFDKNSMVGARRGVPLQKGKIILLLSKCHAYTMIRTKKFMHQSLPRSLDKRFNQKARASIPALPTLKWLFFITCLRFI